MSAGQNLSQGFPDISAALVDPQTGMINQTWLQFLITLWNRTGSGPGNSPDDGFTAALLAEGFPAESQDQQMDLFGDGSVALPPAQSEYLFAVDPEPQLSVGDMIFLAAMIGDNGIGGGAGAAGSVNSLVSLTPQLIVSTPTGDIQLSLEIGTSGDVIPLLSGNNEWNGNNTIDGVLSVVGSAVFGSGIATTALIVTAGGINVTGLGQFNNNVSVLGSMVVAANFAATAGAFTVIDVSSNAVVHGSQTIGGSLNVTGGVSANTAAFNGLNSTNQTTTNLTVSGATAQFNHDASVLGSMGVAGSFFASAGAFVSLDVSANAVVHGSQTISGSLNVSGGISGSSGAFTGLTSTNQTTANLTVTGSNAQFNNNASVLGSLGVGSGLSATNAAFSTLDVAGAVSVHGATATMSGGLVVGSGAAISGGLAVGGAFAPDIDNNFSCGLPGKRFTDIYAVSGSVNPSDIRWKKDIRTLPDDCLSVVLDIEPITWIWDEKIVPSWADGRIHWGFSAQRVEDRLRETGIDCAAVHVDSSGHYNLRTHELVPILWKALAELTKEVRQ